MFLFLPLALAADPSPAMVTMLRGAVTLVNGAERV